MGRAYISIGSNIDPAVNVAKALQLLSAKTRILKISTVYHTAPLSRPEQPWYYNCIVLLETMLDPETLKQDVLHAIEMELGRKRTRDKYAARTIDLDLILYDDLLVRTKELVLPDPDITRRPFVAAALNELSPGLTLPGSQLSIGDIAKQLSQEKLEILDNYTQLLRREVAHGG